MDNLELNIKTDVTEVKQPGFISRIIGIFVSPTEIMKALIEKPRVLFPIFASALGAFTLYLSRFSLYKEFQMAIGEAKLDEMASKLTADQIASSKAIMEKTVSWGLYAVPVSSLLMWIIFTAVVFGLAKAFKGQGKFKQYLSITGYAGVIMLLYYALSIGVSFFSGKLMLDASLANITNLFLPDIKGSYLYGIFRSIDLFGIWQYIVAGIGISLVSKISKVKVYSIIFVIYFAVALYGATVYKFM